MKVSHWQCLSQVYLPVRYNRRQATSAFGQKKTFNRSIECKQLSDKWRAACSLIDAIACWTPSCINLKLWERLVYPLHHAMLFSTGFGIVCGLLLARKLRGFILAVSVLVLAITSILIYSEYFVPYGGGGASMWPIACVGCMVAQAIVKRGT